MPKEGGDGGKEVEQEFTKNTIAVEALIIGARVKAKLTGKTPREIILKQKAQINRKKQKDQGNWLKWIEVALEHIDDPDIDV